jgi:mannose-1-phosphate guanylyltransferase
MKDNQLSAHAVILAGGRGTRFWPRSRTRTPKQLLNIVGEQTMLEQTVTRLAPVFPPSRIWTVTNDEQSIEVLKQLPVSSQRQVLAEPVGRNTAAAIGLAAIHIRHKVLRDAKNIEGDALMAVFPADHYVAKEKSYQQIVRAALQVAAQPCRLVVLGIPPGRPETGFGYIEREAGKVDVQAGIPVYAVRRFTEKPSLSRAKQYIKSQRYHWNAGMFFWRLSTLFECLKKYLPKTYEILMRIAETIGTPRYRQALNRGYQQLDSISIDYAIMEPATREKSGANSVFVLPADVGWSDIGSWAAVYELLAKNPLENVSQGDFVVFDSLGNYFWSPRKLVAAVGVRNLVVVETSDALLVCARDRAQDVAKIVKLLEKKKRINLL